MATHSSILAWRIPRTEEPDALQSMGSQRVRQDWAINTLDFPGGASGKEPTCQCKRHKRPRFEPWVRKTPWRRAWQPTPVFLPGESHWQRSLWATVQGITKGQTHLKQLSTHAQELPMLWRTENLYTLDVLVLPARLPYTSDQNPNEFWVWTKGMPQLKASTCRNKDERSCN